MGAHPYKISCNSHTGKEQKDVHYGEQGCVLRVFVILYFYLVLFFESSENNGIVFVNE